MFKSAAGRALAALFVFGAICVGLLSWSIYHNRVKAAKLEKTIFNKLSAEDIGLLLKSQAQGNPQQLAAINEDAETRQEILKNLKELLAQAAAARRAGLTEDKEIKEELAFSEKVIRARYYNDFQTKGQPAPAFAFVTKEEVDQFWTQPTSEVEFQKIIDSQNKALKTAGRPPVKLEGEMLRNTKEQFAKLMVAYEKSKTDEVFNKEKGREVELQINFQQSLALARAYSEKTLAKKATPTKEEIAAYLAAHPEYDAKKQLQKAESVLQRVKNGEDFAALAKEFSEDPGSKDKGGLYEGITQGQFVPEMEAAALALEPGQTVPNLVETQYGYHIVRLEDKKVENKDGKTGLTYNVRHILISNKFQAPGASPMARPQMLSGEEIAKAKLEEEKREKIIEELVKNNKIDLPADFKVDVPEGADAGQIPLPAAPDEDEVKAPASKEKPAPKEEK